MSISKRQEQILELLRENSYMTVLRLSEEIYTSPSSVRRDLARLEALGLVKRSHGGAGILGETGKVPPLDSRMSRNVQEKRRIAKIAANLLSDGQTVMLDGSSTAGFLVPYIARHADMTLYTNNMNTAMSAISFGIKTNLIGGASVDFPPSFRVRQAIVRLWTSRPTSSSSRRNALMPTELYPMPERRKTIFARL